MPITSYQFQSVDRDLSYAVTPLGSFNLVVGASGSGKSRWLNTLWNLGSFLHNPATPAHGTWRVAARESGLQVRYEVDVSLDRSFEREVLTVGEETVVERSGGVLRWRGAPLPALAPNVSAIAAFPTETSVAQFLRCLKRDFHAGVQETAAARIDAFTEAGVRDDLLLDLGLNARLANLHQTGRLDQLSAQFREIFPTVVALEVRAAAEFAVAGLPPSLHAAPLVVALEHGSDQPIIASELSSGMKKALLILTDLATLPAGWCYILDELENSLGPGALEPIVDHLKDRADLQLFVSTHHPYLISNVRPEHWLVFGRQGREVTIRSGSENEQRYGRSHQDGFFQLLNDPFYRGDVAA